MSVRYDCLEASQRAEGLAAAANVLRRGELAVIPTDTVYGVAADAFTPGAVAGLLLARGQSRQHPPAVLVGSVRTAAALVEDLGADGRNLIEEFWPGALTLVCRANRSLAWDLGDTKGTVAVRMPLHPVALDLLRDTGPLAVSGAGRAGQPPAVSAREAQAQLGEAAAVYLDAGACPGITSTIVDLTGPVPTLLRAGSVPADRLRAITNLIIPGEPDRDTGPPAGGSQPDSAAGSQPDSAGGSQPDSAGGSQPDS